MIPLWVTHVHAWAVPPPGYGLHMAGLFSQTIPPNREKIPPLRTRAIIDPPTWGGHRGLVVGVFDCGPTGRLSNLPCVGALWPPPPALGTCWVNKGLGMSSRVCATGHIWKILCHLPKRVGYFAPVLGFLVSLIKQSSLDWIGYDCMFLPWRWP